MDIETIVGNGVQEDVLVSSNIAGARMLIVAIPNGFEAAALVMRAKALNPGIRVVARAHFDAEVDDLVKHGADKVIMGEKEIAHGMLDYVFAQAGGAAA
jgi:CPA2 family monovalent cation:H+ antiporter-2